jgi:hypothetical protein
MIGDCRRNFQRESRLTDPRAVPTASGAEPYPR